MKVLLIKNVVKLGNRGEVKKVTEGYARNYLFPRNYAVSATPGSIRNVELVKGSWQKKAKNEQDAAKGIAAKLQGSTIKITKKAGDKGRLFGSVTNSEIADLIKTELNLDIDRKTILSDHIKELGQHDVTIRLAADVKATLQVIVLPEETVVQA